MECIKYGLAGRRRSHVGAYGGARAACAQTHGLHKNDWSDTRSEIWADQYFADNSFITQRLTDVPSNQQVFAAAWTVTPGEPVREGSPQDSGPVQSSWLWNAHTLDD